MYLSIWILALSYCSPHYNYYTIHGLWPSQNYCTNTPFSENKIKSIESELNKYWPSCPKYHHTNKWLWTHEWTKHGTCTNMTEYDYFKSALDLRNKYSPDCHAPHNCYICLKYFKGQFEEVECGIMEL